VGKSRSGVRFFRTYAIVEYMLHIALSPELERQLAKVAARVGQAPDEIARKALLAYMEELEDYAVAVEAWKAHDPTKTLTTEQVRRELGLDD
jgi:predicted DNA-binding protein